MSNNATEKEVVAWQCMIERACEKANVNKLAIDDLQQFIGSAKARKRRVPRALYQRDLVNAHLS